MLTLAGDDPISKASVKLTALRDRFRSGLQPRLLRISTSIEEARLTGIHHASEVLRREFHSLAGIGGTFGYPEITRLARQAEQLLEQTSPGGDGFSTLAELSRAVLAIRQIGTEEPEALQTRATLAPGTAMLLMENSPDRAELVGLVEHQGYTVLVFDSAEQAAGALRAGSPALLIIESTTAPGANDLIRAPERSEWPETVVIVIEPGPSNGWQRRQERDRSAAPKSSAQKTLQIILHTMLQRQTGRQRILSVEDDSEQAGVIRVLLESAGYSVRICPDPAEFTRQLEEYRPDLVLMDVNLPGASGYDLARDVRRNPRTLTMPILFLTASNALEDNIAAMRAGGDLHLAKPIVPSLLISSVATQLERARLLREMMTIDPLTGILNRAALLESVQQAFDSPVDSTAGRPGLVVLDVDHFKKINDTFGHQTGDAVLATFGAFLRTRVRLADRAGRYGGEEFFVLLDHVTPEIARCIVARLLGDFAAMEHTSIDGRRFQVTLSAGIALLHPAIPAVSSWIELADRAMYEAKHSGRNRLCAA